MATVTSKTSIKIDELVNGTLVSGYISPTGRLILVNRAGAEQDAGQVVTSKIQARWNASATYVVNDVVTYAGALYKAITSTVAAGLVPAMTSSAWGKLTPMDATDWVDLDPTFEMTTATASLNTFWANGSSVVSLTTAAGEIETGRQSLKVVMGGVAAQRLYSHEENIVAGGEYIQIKVRAKILAGGGLTNLTVNLWQNDLTGIPEVFAPGVVQTGSFEPFAALTTTWTTYTFHVLAVNAKPRAKMNYIVNCPGATGATVLIDSVRIKRVAMPYEDGVWYNAAINMPNVPKTDYYCKFMRIGKTVFVRHTILLTAAPLSTALIDLPFPYASDMIIYGTQKIGDVRGIRQGVAYYEGSITPNQLAGPSRAAIGGQNGTGGNAWAASYPAAWVSGDAWTMNYMYETSA